MQDKIWIIAEAVYHQKYLQISYRKLKGTEPVSRLVKPLGIVFSEHYFYMMAVIEKEGEKSDEQNPAIYRIDRILQIEIQKDHFRIPYSCKFEEYQFRERAPFMFGGDVKRLKFWYSGPSLEAILDKIPTAKVIGEREEKYLLHAEVMGDGAEMWLRGQGNYVEFIKE